MDPRPRDLQTAPAPPPTDAEGALWAQFAQAGTPEAFSQTWLALQCRMIPGVSGGLVLLGTPDRGPFSPTAVWPDVRRSMKYLTPTAERALVERRGLLVRQEPDGDAGAPSRDRFDVAYPIEVGGRLHGVVVLDVAPRPEAQLQTVLRQLHWGAGWLEALFRREEAARDAAAKDRMQAVLDLAAAAAGHRRFYAAATSFVTELATRLGCDRASLGFTRGGRVHVRAVSHSAQFGKQTNLIRAIGAAMDEAFDQQATLVYPPPEGPVQVTREHAELARRHGAGAICSIPISDGTRAVGVLTLERPAERPFDRATVDLCEATGALAGPFLEAQRREDRWLPAKAIESLRTHLGYLVGPRHMALKLTVLLLLAAAAFLTFARGDFRVTAKTVLEGEIRRAAVAPFNGYILEARARAGDVVRKGQALCVLDDRELRLERAKWVSQQEQVVRQYQKALAGREAAQLQILAAQLDQARAQLALIEDQLSRTRVVAPFDGVVVEGDLSQKLGAPVERGQVLFEVAPLESYRVVVQVDERDVAYVAVGQRGYLVLSAFANTPIPVAVQKITPVSAAHEGRNVFRVEARAEGETGRLRPGMEGVAKIAIGRERLAWIWTRQTIDWFRLTLWTWLP